MSRAHALTVEPSRDDAWGIPYPARSARVRTLRRVALTTVAVTTLVAGSAATAASLTGRANAGFASSSDGARVAAVSPTGFAWKAGVRPGQTVVVVPDPEARGGWRLVTRDGSRQFVAKADDADLALRTSLPLAIAATALGALAVVLLRGHRRWVIAAACAGLSAAAFVLDASGNPDSSTLSLGGAALAPAVWLAWRPGLPTRLSLALTGTVTLLLAAWVVARLAALPVHDILESLRGSLTFIGLVAVIAVSILAPIVRDGFGTLDRPRVGGILLLAAVAGIGLGLVAPQSMMITGTLAFVAVVGVPAWRRWLAAGAERMLLADLREHARLEAAEAERAHLSRELHDVPLQQLAGIIRRLELLPEARAESEELRAVAEQLRGVATELRPPVLDDLGLAPALEFLAEAASTDEVAVVAEVEDLTSLDVGGRPPAEVELAIFRVAQEAVANALRHAQASEISLAGEVAAGRVVLTVTDDGRGLDEAEARAAGRRGRLGLASIRRRAEAIDAEVDISGSREGTRVVVRWTR